MVNCNRLIATALYNNSHSFSYLGYGDGDTLGAAFNQLGYSLTYSLTRLLTHSRILYRFNVVSFV